MAQRRVAVIAPPWYPVPPQGYGGIEVVVDLLVRGLRRRGVDVLLYGAAGSCADTVELAPPEFGADLLRPFHVQREVTYAMRVMADLQTREVDLIHDHSGWVALAMAGFMNRVPLVHTVHVALFEPSLTAYQAVGDRASLVAISNNQQASAPDLNWAGVVHNAADVASLRVGSDAEREDYLLCLARICPHKGQHVAIEVARQTGMRLVLAGKVGENEGDDEYFEREVAPHIDGDRVRWLGNVMGDEKRELLARAHALLAPLSWPEPFGVAMLEGMVSGTPVIATPMGAMPELVTHGVTGFLVRDVPTMVQAVRHVDLLDRARCATTARQRFSPLAMADAYIDIYEHVLEQAAAPVTTSPVIELAGARAHRGRIRATAPVRPDEVVETVGSTAS